MPNDPLQTSNNPYAVASGPSLETVVITPSDDAGDNFSKPIRAVSVGTGGDISVVDYAGNTRLFKNRIAGTELPVVCLRVNETDTTAEDLVGLY